ncbi:hypothetical protein RQP46_000422 [Phenoliferia psychrophenolica]
MSIFTRSMYGLGGTRTGMSWEYSAGDPVSPIGPDIAVQDDWWFRGPGYRALAPAAGEVTELPAGGQIVLEITCRIANVDDISKATMDNIAIFSVQENTPTNVVYPDPSTGYVFNNARPGYHSSWSFQDGAQNDIFEPLLPSIAVPASPSITPPASNRAAAAEALSSRLAAIASRKQALKKTATAPHSRRTLSVSSPIEPTGGLSEVPEAFEQGVDSDLLDDLFEEQEWAAKAMAGSSS